ncbi:craniofacial development protein 1 [Ischnura elegans]|uniref:craniofacial development protein 1 n=1 Tax=Ischnura elegans TaxID=197161 RepID=UPI001ED89DA7|nr:craniofacial development protein 1 [Ischnura elegans]
MSSSGSDSGDEDYVPSDGGSQPPSEVESDGDEEELEECDDGEAKQSAALKKKGGKRRVGEPPLANAAPEEKESTEDIKQKSESLWSDFLKDVSNDGAGSKGEGVTEEANKVKPEKKRITEVYEFAGEKVTVSKEVTEAAPSKVRKITALLDEDSGSAGSAVSEREEESKGTDENKGKPPLGSVSRSPALGLSDRSRAIMKPNVRVGGSSLSSALDKLGKKNKLSTLEKSKLDWENYKSKEGISEEITAHNKGKSGFLDKRDFLEKTDLKQYELEKQMRNSLRRKL